MFPVSAVVPRLQIFCPAKIGHLIVTVPAFFQKGRSCHKQFGLLVLGAGLKSTLLNARRKWRFLFYGELIINWVIPFALLLSNYLVSHKNTLLSICVIIIIGQWVDLYQQVIVGTYGKLEIGLIEIGMFLGFAGLFAFMVARSLASAAMVPKHHPYLEESLQHH